MPLRGKHQRRQSPRLHFSVRRLLLITTLLAVVTGTAWRLHWPNAARTLVAIYLFYLLACITIVLPRVFAPFRRDRRRLAERRAELLRRYGGRDVSSPPDGDDPR